MAEPALTEKDFTGVAEKALAGDREGAVDAAVTVLATAATGSPLVGVVAGKGARALVGAAVGGATRRLQDADKAYDNEQARNREFQSLVYDALKPAFEAIWNRDEERLAGLIRHIDLTVASAEEQAELRKDVAQLLVEVRELKASRRPGRTRSLPRARPTPSFPHAWSVLAGWTHPRSGHRIHRAGATAGQRPSNGRRVDAAQIA